MKPIKIISAVLAVAMIFTTLPFTAYGANETEDISAAAVLQSGDLMLSVADDGALTFKNTKTGQTVSSRSGYAENDSHSAGLVRKMMISDIAIEYYAVRDALLSNATTKGYSDEAQVSVKNENGVIRVSYDFADIAISFDVCYLLEKEYLSAKIDFKSIKESRDFELLKVTLLPALFSATGDDNGYILVPDGSGALINFNNNSTAAYNAPVYGEEIAKDIDKKTSYTRNIAMPVFGMQKNGNGLFAIIDEGDAIAEISAASKNDESYYNYVNTTANIRCTYEKSMFTANDVTSSAAYKKINQTKSLDGFSVRYYLLGNGAGYTEMAQKYRDYLTDEKGLEKQECKAELNVEIIGAIDVKANFLGFTYYKPYALTRYDEAESFISELKKSGAEKLSIKYSGWSNNGLTNNKVMTKTSPMKVLGGKKSLNKLNSFLTENNISAEYDVDLLKFYKGGKKYRVSSPFNESVEFSRYLRSVYVKDINKKSWYLLSPKFISKNFASAVKSLENLKISSVSLSSLTGSLYSDFNDKAVVSRMDMINEVTKALEKSGDKLKFSGENANAYTVPYLTKIYSAPAYSSGYTVFDKEIPLYQIVFHGIVNLTGESQFISNDRQINFLKAVETGSQLLYTGMAAETSEIVDTDYDYLYGTSFNLWQDDAVSKYKQYMPLLEKICSSVIISRREVSENVYETKYENGISVIVNYNPYEVKTGNIVVPAYGFSGEGAQ